MTKVPKHGDPEILPRPTIVRPTSSRMPYTTSGKFKPEGPEFDVPISAPDIRGLPYIRSPRDRWTTESQRKVILTWLKDFFRRNSGVVRWEAHEGRTGTFSSLFTAPRLRVVVFERTTLNPVESSRSFSSSDLKDAASLRAALDVLSISLEAQLI